MAHRRITVATLAYVGALSLATLYPYRFSIPTYFQQGEPAARPAPEWHAADGMVFRGVGMFSTRAPRPDLADAITAAGACYVYLEARPDTVDQAGPRRMVTYSRSPLYQAFMVGQEDTALVCRVAGPTHPIRGRLTHEALFPDALEAGVWHRLLVTADATGLRAFRDGRSLGTHPLPAFRPAAWLRTCYLVAGNEATGDRGWHGRLRRVELGAGPPPAPIRERAGIARAHWPGQAATAAPATPLFALAAADSARPADWTSHTDDVWGRPQQPPWALVPFRDSRYVRRPWIDWLVNVGLFVPIGWLAALRGRSLWGAVLIGASISVGIEAAQIFLPSRMCDATDLLLNTLGAGIGALVARDRPAGATPPG